MMPENFKNMKGYLYVQVNGDKIWRKVEEPCNIGEVIELIEEQAKKKHLREGMEKLREKLKKKKLENHMAEHMAAVLHELRHAMHNHPDDKWPWNSFDFVHQTAVMMEEAGEAVRAANNLHSEGGDQMALYGELAQTAAMCLRIMEQIKEFSIHGEGGN